MTDCEAEHIRLTLVLEDFLILILYLSCACVLLYTHSLE